MPGYKYMEENGSATILASKRLAVIALEMNLREHVTHMPKPIANKVPHSALKPREDVTRSPKQETLKHVFGYCVIGFYVIPGGRRGNYSFEINYPKLPQGRYVLYTGFGKLLDESQGARYIDHGDWETYIIYDVYMKTSILVFPCEPSPIRYTWQYGVLGYKFNLYS